MPGGTTNSMYSPTRFSTLKNNIKKNILWVVIATGISSVVTQLLTIREFLAQFSGNEFVIALILFSWLIIGGTGTLLAGFFHLRFQSASLRFFFGMSLLLAALSPVQILGIRFFRDVFFIQGSDIGFYPCFAFVFLTILPYSLLVGFVLPYSLFVIRNNFPDYSGTRIYITDNIGDVAGGALFSFALVYLFTPLQALFLANLPLLVFSCFLFKSPHRSPTRVLLPAICALVILLTGMAVERKSLHPDHGKPVHYEESKYGRISVQKNREQFTLFQDGIPVFSSRNLSMAEETVHYPLAQLSRPRHILLISGEAGMMTEIEKHKPETIDYVELDPALTPLLFKYGLIKKINALEIFHVDARAFLRNSDKSYDAIILNLPEPATFQLNRFFTDEFFDIAKAHLSDRGILSFSMEGFENYLAEPQRQKLSSLFNTVSPYFQNILLIPGQKVFFLCSDDPLSTDIPTSLDHKGISTTYIKGFFYGNVTDERVDYLREQMDPAAPVNTDLRPQLMRIMFSQWFLKFATSPRIFSMVIILIFLAYIIRTTRETYVLFTTGLMTMGSEILVIFAFQIFFGYIYLQIGLIVTVFLAGLLPGALLGERFQHSGRPLLGTMDVLLMILMGVFILAVHSGGGMLHEMYFLIFGFLISFLCGFQLPLALFLKGKSHTAVTELFSADLIGAAFGTLILSVVLIPFTGILYAAAFLIILKGSSLIILLTGYAKHQQTPVSMR